MAAWRSRGTDVAITVTGPRSGTGRYYCLSSESGDASGLEDVVVASIPGATSAAGASLWVSAVSGKDRARSRLPYRCGDSSIIYS